MWDIALEIQMPEFNKNFIVNTYGIIILSATV